MGAVLAVILAHATPFVPGIVRGPVRHGRDELSPGDVAVLHQRDLFPVPAEPSGFVIIDPAPFSHPMIRLLGMARPTVTLASGEEGVLQEGAEVIVDGYSGTVSDAVGEGVGPWGPRERAPAAVTTADGRAVELLCSISDAQAGVMARSCGAAGIGLVRSEYLFPAEGRKPDADFFESALAELCRAVHPLPLNIRLPDIAADKRPPWLDATPGLSNPLGLRGVRLYGDATVRSVVEAEIEAVARLAPTFDLAILLPYVTRVEEFVRLRRWVEELLPAPMMVGPMLENPAAVLALEQWRELTSLTAIGCNDLVQALFAADRDISPVNRLLDPYAPVIYRLLRMAASAAGDHLERVLLCGLLPQLPGILPVLLGLGFRRFSVEPVLLPGLAAEVACTSDREAEALAAAVCAAPNSDSVRALLGLPWVGGAGF